MYSSKKKSMSAQQKATRYSNREYCMGLEKTCPLKSSRFFLRLVVSSCPRDCILLYQARLMSEGSNRDLTLRVK